ncbi:MAG TPA: adenine deaminase C-terminal domain-containing protein, partial [Chitinophagaceae bacterium]|nr:adenine deaminase C-terminal domain-containing protein [Chitinophagaceae bacterium]
EYAQQAGKPVDGHAPGLRGEQAKTYIDAGITTDHECTTYDEAAEKLSYGMKILIREGSAAKNFDALIDLLPQHWQQMMFCCDDKHPDELVLHHMNHHVKRALAKGMDLFKVLTVACINPIEHYKMDVGQLRVGDKADFIIIDNLEQFTILKTVIEGQTVYEQGEVLFPRVDEICINQFQCKEKSAQDFAIPVDKAIHQLRVIEALDGQLITRTHIVTPRIEEGCIISDPEHDILKMVIVNRYQDAPIAKAFIKNIGLKQGAIASTVAHDSHQLLCVGVNDEAIAKAVNALIRCQGGVAVVNDEQEYVLPLPVGGLMSNHAAQEVAASYSQLDQKAKEFGSQLAAPFMTLSFMALLVIPQLKLSDKGLFDGQAFQFVDLFE